MCKNHSDRESQGFCVKCGAPVCEECLTRNEKGRPVCNECLEAMQAFSSPSAPSAPSLAPREIQSPSVVSSSQDDPGIAPDAGLSEPSPTLGSAASDFFQRTSSKLVRIPKEFRRAMAIMIDMLIIGALSAPAAVLLQSLTMITFHEVSGIGYTLSGIFAVIVVSLLYMVLTVTIMSGTIGKRICGLKIVNTEVGIRISFIDAVWRWIGFFAAAIWAYWGFALGKILVINAWRTKVVPVQVALLLVGIAVFLFFGSGLFITLVGKHKRGFHDILADSIVINDIVTGKEKTEDENQSGKVSGSDDQKRKTLFRRR